MVPRPVMVVGIAPGCGAATLVERLAAHPRLARPGHVDDNRLGRGAGPLWDGVRRIAAALGDAPDAPAPSHRLEADLAERVGDGVLGWLAEDAGTSEDQRLLTATWQAEHLAGLVRLCRGSDVVVVVADGRTVARRGMAERGWSFEQATTRWLRGASQVLAVLGRPLPMGVRIRRIGVEELAARPVEGMRRLLDWLDLDPNPVLAAGRDAPTPEGELYRWSPGQRARFALRAGVYLRALGYDAPAPDRPEAAAAVAAEAGARLRRFARRLL